jgi:hypothetical protein
MFMLEVEVEPETVVVLMVVKQAVEADMEEEEIVGVQEEVVVLVPEVLEEVVAIFLEVVHVFGVPQEEVVQVQEKTEEAAQVEAEIQEVVQDLVEMAHQDHLEEIQEIITEAMVALMHQ